MNLPRPGATGSSDVADAPYRAGFVAIVGRPNVGKSTLMNRMIRERLSIVTPKPQTTRQRVLGILTEPGYQAVFVDTPGLLAPGYKLQACMLQAALRTIREADVTIAMADATRSLRDLDPETTAHLTHSGGPVVLAINKIDRIRKPRLLPLMDDARRRFPFSAIIPISALRHEGIDDLLSCMTNLLPPGPPLYPPDMITDRPERFFVAEMVREQAFLTLQDELPYACAVRVEEFTQRETGTLYIRAVIIIEKASQKAIIIGRRGQMIKRIGSVAKQHIEAFLDRPVYLDLWVTVHPGWRKRDAELERLGYA